MLPHDTVRIIKYKDHVRIDFSSLSRSVSEEQISRTENSNPFNHDFSLIIRNGEAVYPQTPEGTTPSIVLLDWSRNEYVNLVEKEFELDEDILMKRRLMIHKKMITSYIVDVVKAEVAPVTNMFGFQRYLPTGGQPAY